MKELLAQTIATARVMNAVTARDLERVIIDSRVQVKAISFPTNTRFLEVGCLRLVLVSQREGLSLRQTYEYEGASLNHQVGHYAHARQFKRMRRAIKLQRTFLGQLIRDIERKLSTVSEAGQATLRVWEERTTRVMTQ